MIISTTQRVVCLVAFTLDNEAVVHALGTVRGRSSGAKPRCRVLMDGGEAGKGTNAANRGVRVMHLCPLGVLARCSWALEDAARRPALRHR